MLERVRSLFQPGAAPEAQDGGARLADGFARAPLGAGVLRHSNGLSEFFKSWEQTEGRRVLDLGCTSSSNLNYFTGHGHSIHSDDLLYEASQPRYQVRPEGDASQAPVFSPALWLAENLRFPPDRFDGILLWDLVDYLPEPLVRPMLDRLTAILKTSGTVLAYFHTKDAGPEAPFYRYHIHDHATLQLRPGAPARLQRVFNNRHVEHLFHGYRSVKFFLARDNLREVLATK